MGTDLSRKSPTEIWLQAWLKENRSDRSDDDALALTILIVGAFAGCKVGGIEGWIVALVGYIASVLFLTWRYQRDTGILLWASSRG
ncbi:MAG: hypothetical protein JOZ41_04080 [Chloroflexi bacterium]|nr:hypothetical protein [Chloroflexota bacterium]